MSNFKRPARIIAWVLLLCLLAVPALAPISAAQEEADMENSSVAEANLIVSAVYYSPNTFSSVIGCLEDGTVLAVLGETGEFYRIDCYDMTGYIAKAQVTKDETGEYYVNCSDDAPGFLTLETRTAREALSVKGQIRSSSMKFVGVPYVSGGTTPRGFDCSGFTQYVFGQMGIQLNRTVAAQLQNGVIVSKEDLQSGDLIFFQNTTGWGHFASHVGIYIGNGQMIHAGSRGIAVVSLEEAYYTYHYMCARRVILSQLPQESTIPATGINRNMNGSYWRESSQTEVSGNFFAEILASA